ncbi:MAG: YgaP family membrane protein [Candidatus Nanopelagicales bacterium]
MRLSDHHRANLDSARSAIGGWFRPDHCRVNLGREDRLVRACVALSLLLMSAFGLLGGFRITFIALVFGLAGLYAAVTAFTGRDALYRRFGIDSRSEDELDEAEWRANWTAQAAEMNSARHAVTVDLRDLPEQPQWGSSLLERR